MNKVTLSICIATRNRATFIGATLESIVSQANEQVEIVVLDGASTDNTEEIVRCYQKRFPRLLYSRQETNSGIDRDFAKAVDLANGDYCWLFCDDDLIKPGAIQTVLDATEQDYALIVANSEIRNADLSKVLESRRMQVEKDRIYKSTENSLLLADVTDYLSFIGGVIIKRQIWSAREKKKYFGSYFTHVGVIFQKILPGDALVIAEPLISIRYENASWLHRYFEIWMFKWPDLVWSFDFSDSAKSRVCAREPWRNLKTLLHFRAKGAYTNKEYAELIEPRTRTFWDRMLYKATAYFPGRAANLLVFLWYSIFRRKSLRLLHLADVTNSPFCFWKFSAKSLKSSRISVRDAAFASPSANVKNRVING